MTTSESQSRFRGLLAGSGIVLLGMVLRVLLTFATEVLLARHLGPDPYGVLAWGLAAVNVAAVMSSAGLATAARRFIPLFMEKKDIASLRGSLVVMVVVSATGGILGLAVFLFGAEYMGLHFFGDAREIPVLRLLAVAIPFWNLQKLFLGVAAGFKQPGVKVMVEDFMAPVGFLAIAVGARVLDYGVMGIVSGYVVVYVVTSVVAGLAVRRRAPAEVLAAVSPRFRTKEILSFSWPLAFTEVLGKSTGIFQLLIIGMLVQAADVGNYRVASDLAITMSVILMCFGFLYLPMASELFARRDFAAWKLFSARVARWTMFLSFPIFAVLFFRSDEVLAVLYGPRYAVAASLLPVLACAYFFHAIVGFTGSNLIVAGLTGWQLVAHACALCVMIFGNLLLVPRYGILGAAYVTLATLITSNGINIFLTVIKTGVHSFSVPYFRALAVLLFIGVAADHVTRLVNVQGLAAVLIYSAVVGVALLAVAGTSIVLDQEDRDNLRSLIRSRRQTVG